MRSLVDIETAIKAAGTSPDEQRGATELLRLSEEILEHWVIARGDAPTRAQREGFRLLALHRQGAGGDPSFNACRETCREVAYYFNLITMQADAEKTDRLLLMSMVTTHLYLFISGKLQVAQLGDFCCASKPVRSMPKDDPDQRVRTREA